MEAQVRAKAQELGFAIDPQQRVDSLSIAEQQRVEILKVLLAGARILILDEPTAVLTDEEASRLLHTVRGLAAQGAAVILVTHKMADVKAFADRVTVMRGGRTVATVDPGPTPVAELVRLTVGDTQPALARQAQARGAPRLTLRDLATPASTPGSSAARRALDGVNLCLHAGEVYGLAGVGGNGQSELAAAVMGLPDDRGEPMVFHSSRPLRAGFGGQFVGGRKLCDWPSAQWPLRPARLVAQARCAARGASGGCRIRCARRAPHHPKGRALVGRQCAEAGDRPRVQQGARHHRGAQPQPRLGCACQR
jgi:energy-coupling factor transporter ATP-binding protein EcfA2